ncbi:MAG: DUF2029 domain-containing protein [Eubacterium sp.]|nr:DUF2029 domain-containing protein [Eubacterium sp.]
MKQKLKETKHMYILLSLITLVSVVFALLISNGKLFQVFFFLDPDDTGMDFFNSMIEVGTRRPYDQYHVLYPPLANLFFYILSLFIPDALKAGWPATHDAVKGIVGTREDLRLTQSALMIFLLFLILTLFAIAVMIHSCTHSYLLTFCLTFSAGTMSAIERGNVILLAFVLTFYFVKHYNDENKLKSELALIAVAAAFGFKLYPCIFGLLLLKDRKFAAAGRCILYAVLFTVLPTFVFEGPSSIIPWLKYVFGIGGSTGTATATEGTGSGIPWHLVLFLILGLFLMIALMIRRNGKPVIPLKDSQILFLITYLSLLIGGGAGGYNLIFFIVPFLAFLQEERTLNRCNIIEFLIYMICLLPAGINQMNYLFFLLFLIGCGCRLFLPKPRTI